jgi:hypothetical protein
MSARFSTYCLVSSFRRTEDGNFFSVREGFDLFVIKSLLVGGGDRGSHSTTYLIVGKKDNGQHCVFIY